jgi:outer membrane protein OmpA-like peptidoglycan-associated protein
MDDPPASTEKGAKRARSGGTHAGRGKPAPAPDVTIGVDRVFRLSYPLRFEGANARLAPDAGPMLDVIARVLRENPEVRRLQIAAHWDDSLPADKAKTLTEAQAEAIRDELLKRGIAADHLVAAGLGATKPLASRPSTGARTPNRRVELRAE